MGKKSKQAKKSDSISINPKKQPKQSPEIDPDILWNKKASWSISNLDMAGEFGWHTVDLKTFLYIQNKLSNFETMTWREIFIGAKKQNHSCSKDGFSLAAKKRLKELELDDYEELHSLRLEGKKRVWGIFEDGYFRILWWDPDHQVYPSKKKHT